MLDSDCSVVGRLVNDTCGAPDDTDIESGGARDEDNKVSELLPAPVAEAVDTSGDVQKPSLAVISDREAVTK